MRDVADRAEVSVTTVSHVINNTRHVSDELSQRVITAMDELGYQPNILARSLRRGETKTVGVILPDSSNPYFAELARGIEDSSFEKGYSVILCNSDNSTEKERLYTKVLAEKQVDGIVMVPSTDSPESIIELLNRKIALVLVDRFVSDVDVDYVLVDNKSGGDIAVQHLIDLGHKRIGCVLGLKKVLSSDARLEGYRQALNRNGIAYQEEFVYQGNFQYKSGFEAAEKLLSKDNKPSAIFACNDLMAVGVVSNALERGFSIPDHLSVVGFDDIPLATYANPPITTINQPKYGMGALATEMLLQRMRNPQIETRREILDLKIVIRKSTAQFN